MADKRYYRSQSLNAQWQDLNQSISNLLVEHEGSQKPEVRPGVVEAPNVTTRHWVDSQPRTYCIDPQCMKKFTIKERKHHCRRCGEVFCGSCTQLRRRLSIYATPDPEGISYRVCKSCFDVGPQTPGFSKSIFEEFRQIREQIKASNNNKENKPIAEKITYKQECDRLVEGFKKKVGSSKIKTFVLETVGAMTVPSWQKSKHWVAKSDFCLLCYKKFTMTDLKSHCRVCGHVVCSSCSSDNLIVFVDDVKKVMWSLINIIGSPDEEPPVCLYLKICNRCHGELAEIQGRAAIEAERTVLDGPPMLDSIANIHDTLVCTQNKITKLLPKYESLVDAVEAKVDLKGLVEEGKSATQTLAKYHLDLSDLFTQFAVDMQGIKRLKPRTNTQVKLARNLTTCKFGFYRDHFPAYRECKKRLAEVLPHTVLEAMQVIVDEQAINNAYVVVKQLGLEALYLATTHSIDEEIPLLLARCEEICFDDLQKQIESTHGDWETHIQTVKELLQIQLKKHRLVKPSKRCTERFGAGYVRAYLLDRAYILLCQTQRQLGGKTAEKKFQLSKNALETANAQITAMR